MSLQILHNVKILFVLLKALRAHGDLAQVTQLSAPNAPTNHVHGYSYCCRYSVDLHVDLLDEQWWPVPKCRLWRSGARGRGGFWGCALGCGQQGYHTISLGVYMYSNTSHPVYYERSKRWPVKMARMARTVRNELMNSSFDLLVPPLSCFIRLQVVVVELLL